MPMQVICKTGMEPFRDGDVLLKRTLLDSWRWPTSHLVSSVMPHAAFSRNTLSPLLWTYRTYNELAEKIACLNLQKQTG